MLTPAQIADTLQVSPATVRRWSARFARHLTVLEQGEHLARRQELVGRNVGRYPNSATVAVLEHHAHGANVQFLQFLQFLYRYLPRAWSKR